MITWISLKDKKPRIPKSEDDPIFQIELIFIKHLNKKIIYTDIFGWNNIDINDEINLVSISGEYITIKDGFYPWTHWAEINAPEDIME